METNQINRRNIGLNFNHGAFIRVWSPEAKSVSLKTKDGKVFELRPAGHGYWEASSRELKAGDQYKFVLDGKKELPDPASLSQPEGVHGWSAAVDINDFTWADTDWKNIPLSDYIFYELHTGTFTPSGDFAGILNKLDYLVELGITAIEIMPVAQFPGERNWGYDGVFPFAVQNTYGGAEGLQKMVDACHQKGLAVVLDVVYNHLGPEGNYLPGFGPYFTDKYQTPWGNAINFDDSWCGGVRDYFIENALMWFRDFHIDALRLDAVHAIKDLGPKHILEEIKERVEELGAISGRRYYLIIECDLNDPRFINPAKEGGYGMDAQWTDEFHHALRVTAGQKQTGYYADFSGIKDLAKAYADAYVFDGRFSPGRSREFGAPTHNPGWQFVVFSQNHDQVGNRMFGERTSKLVSFEMQKLLAAAVMVSPYLPLLFMGEEMNETNPFLYFVSHTDKQLIDAVRKGRRAEFKDFHSDGEAPDPQDPDTFNHSKLRWETEAGPGRTMLNFYKALINLRIKQPALSSPDRKRMTVDYNEQAATLILRRWCEEQQVICLMNFSPQKQMFSLKEDISQWQQIFNSADPYWHGGSSAPEFPKTGITADLPPESMTIYSEYHV